MTGFSIIYNKCIFKKQREDSLMNTYKRFVLPTFGNRAISWLMYSYMSVHQLQIYLLAIGFYKSLFL